MRELYEADFHKPDIFGEADKYELTRGACFVARRLEVVAVAVLLWISWCVLGAKGFFFFSSFFFLDAHGLLQVQVGRRLASFVCTSTISYLVSANTISDVCAWQAWHVSVAGTKKVKEKKAQVDTSYIVGEILFLNVNFIFITWVSVIKCV